jgi:hypothetical protein
LDRYGPLIWRIVSNGLYYVILFGAFLAYAASNWEQAAIFAGIWCLVLGSFICALVHESGHALAALARGWRVIQFVARPIGIQLPNRNLAFVRDSDVEEAGGWVVTVPGTARAGTRTNKAIVLASGPAASFALAGLACLVWSGVLQPFGGSYVIRQLALGLAIQSLLAAVYSLLPDDRGLGRTDGDQLRALLGEGDAWEYKPIGWIKTLLDGNVRLSALPDWLLDEARNLAPRSEEIARYVATLEIGRILDSPPVDKARSRLLIDEYRARFGTDGWLAACDAYLAAIWERDPGRAAEALREVPATPEPWALSLAAQAAVAASQGETALAEVRLKEMVAAVEKASPFPDLTFRDIRRQIEGALA